MKTRISFVLGLALALCLCPFAVAEEAATPASEFALLEGGGCAAPNASVDPGDFKPADEPVSVDGCCYSDPCEGWGTYRASCCEDGCTAYSTYVWCPSGDVLCPDPCAANGICNSSCFNDPDCGPSCQFMVCERTSQCNSGYSCVNNCCV